MPGWKAAGETDRGGREESILSYFLACLSSPQRATLILTPNPWVEEDIPHIYLEKGEPGKLFLLRGSESENCLHSLGVPGSRPLCIHSRSVVLYRIVWVTLRNGYSFSLPQFPQLRNTNSDKKWYVNLRMAMRGKADSCHISGFKLYARPWVKNFAHIDLLI